MRVSMSPTRRCNCTAATAIFASTVWRRSCAISGCTASWREPTKSCGWSSAEPQERDRQGIRHLLNVALFGLASALLQIFARYSRYVSVLKWLTISLFAYVAVALVVNVPWLTVVHDMVLPKVTFSADYLTTVVALLGTTISPYLFFWQAEEEVEETKERSGAMPLDRAPEQ